MHQHTNKLRETAEAALRKLKPDMDAVETQDMAKILEELYIHQLELEIQNAALQTAYQELDQERSRYSTLYQTMPVGHVTLDVNGVIVEANRHASYLLDSPESGLIGKALNSFFRRSEQNRLYLHLHRLLKQQLSQVDELLIETAAHGQRHLQIISHPIHDLNPLACHSILVDVSDHKRRLVGEALEATGILLTGTLETETVLEQILKQLGQIVPHDLALITLIEHGQEDLLKLRYCYDPDAGTELHPSLIPFYPSLKEILEKQVPAFVSDLSEDFADLQLSMLSGIKSCLISPLLVGETPLGFLWLASRNEQFLLHENFRDIASFARQASLALNNDPQHQDAQAIVRMQKREQMVYERHDTLQENRLPASRHHVSEALSLESPILLQDLQPEHILNIEEKLAIPLLAEMVSGPGIEVSLDLRLDKALSFKLKVNSYRILQEALTNIRQHAQSKAVRIRLHSLDKTLSLMIQSQGFGLDELSKDSSFENIRKRVENSHGRFKLLTKHDSGSCLAIFWSLQFQ